MKLQKQWFTLQEVADRWSELTGETVTVDDALHFAETNRLFVCAYLENLPPANWLQGLPAGIDRSTLIKNMEEGTENEEHTRQTKEFRMNAAHLCAYRPFHFNEYWKQGIAPASGILYLLLDVFRVGENVKCKALGNTWLLLADGGLKPEIAGVYYTVMGNAIDMMLLDTPVTIPLNEIVLITEEIERFEQAQGIGKPDTTTAPKAKNKPGRPKDPDALNNRLDELKADAIKEAGEFKNKRGTLPMLDDIAGILAHKPNWKGYIQETIKTHLRAAWWK